VKRSVNTIIVEPGTLLREGLAALLHDSDFRVIYAVATPGEVPANAIERATLLIVGASSEPERARDYVKQISASTRQIQIIVFSESCGKVSQLDTLEFLRNGADGCIFDVRSRDILLKSLHLVVLGQRIVILGENETPLDISEHEEPLAISSIDDSPLNGDAGLSTRELEILSYIVNGHSNKLIARNCKLAEATVRIHLKAILRKIHVQNRTQAAVWAVRNADRNALSLIVPLVLWCGVLTSLMGNPETMNSASLFLSGSIA
jgi:two-component system nitrate/nitrite response regulator NarL